MSISTSASATDVTFAIHLGALWLDEQHKDWQATDFTRLNLGNAATCPLALIQGDPDWDEKVSCKDAIRYGLTFEIESAATVELANKCWKQEIAFRRRSKNMTKQNASKKTAVTTAGV